MKRALGHWRNGAFERWGVGYTPVLQRSISPFFLFILSLSGSYKMNYIVREFRVGDRHDAELLAAMWNASDAGWPWGWTRGVPETAERILDRTQKIDRIAIYVVEIDGEIVGYGDLEQTRGRDDSAYLSTLNVRPDLHGKGLGKALVLKILERTIEKGFRQLTIGTWAGNRKSVPLYKKTGFFWVPDTSVWM